MKVEQVKDDGAGEGRWSRRRRVELAKEGGASEGR